MIKDKSKYEAVGGSVEVDRYWKPQEIGDSIEGRLVSKQPKREDFSALYILEGEGERIGVNGTAVLDTKLGNIAEGKIVAIEYLGDVASKIKGRKPYKDFYVGQGKDVVGDEEASYPDKF